MGNMGLTPRKRSKVEVESSYPRPKPGFVMIRKLYASYEVVLPTGNIVSVFKRGLVTPKLLHRTYKGVKEILRGLGAGEWYELEDRKNLFKIVM